MSKHLRYLAEKNIDPAAECFVSFVYGGFDDFYLHSHDYFEIFIVAKGVVPHTVNGTVQHLPEGTLMFIRPQDVHSHHCENPDIAFVNLTFTSHTARLLLSYLFDDEQSEKMLSCDMPPMVLLDKSSKKCLISQLNALNSENWKDKAALKIRMRSLLATIFPYFLSSLESQSENEIPLWLSQLSSEMAKPENFTEGTKRMLALSKKSREHLSRSFKKYYDTTITEYLNDLKVNYASNLLINSNIPVIDIGFQCGFQSTSYFYRIFKERNGMTPVEFRKQQKNGD